MRGVAEDIDRGVLFERDLLLPTTRLYFYRRPSKMGTWPYSRGPTRPALGTFEPRAGRYWYLRLG
jgi:hypothetical protein